MVATVPGLRGPVNFLRLPWLWPLRVLLGVVLVLGSFLAILPVFGVWMLPLGLLLLAIDMTRLQRPVTGAILRARWRFRAWRRSRRRR